jgi:hypothetical protein
MATSLIFIFLVVVGLMKSKMLYEFYIPKLKNKILQLSAILNLFAACYCLYYNQFNSHLRKFELYSTEPNEKIISKFLLNFVGFKSVDFLNGR